jgi:hypothetical protein
MGYVKENSVKGANRIHTMCGLLSALVQYLRGPGCHADIALLVDVRGAACGAYLSFQCECIDIGGVCEGDTASKLATHHLSNPKMQSMRVELALYTYEITRSTI